MTQRSSAPVAIRNGTAAEHPRKRPRETVDAAYAEASPLKRISGEQSVAGVSAQQRGSGGGGSSGSDAPVKRRHIQSCGELEELAHSLRFSREPQMCVICIAECPAWSSVQLPCGHGWYCGDCMQQHAEARLSVGAVEVPCPECGKVLAQAVIRALLSSQLVDRLLERSLEKAIGTSNDLWPCPTPDCPNRVALEPGQTPQLRCSTCCREHCLLCHAEPFHVGLTCEQHKQQLAVLRRRPPSGTATAAAAADDDGSEALHKWIKKTGAQQCPKCGVAITKDNLRRQRAQDAECHKMICRNCSTRFCFGCLSIFTGSLMCKCTDAGHGFIDPVTGIVVFGPDPARWVSCLWFRLGGVAATVVAVLLLRHAAS
eukprot:NODE_8664_length_1478_cov_6.877868.p1 GENE.NODE_8664_length_1478_cov_6.877868~~NODE_8664_length_1478_cov_6.877868.p1  ORF type:complete len:371 (-),score=84.25 NODE_8664_length_1478_cov_6.877868:222-1334(-)